MTNNIIVKAQKVLRKLEGTPIVVQPDNSVRVTYDYDTYSALFEVLVAVSKESIREIDLPEYTYPKSITEYHREKI